MTRNSVPQEKIRTFNFLKTRFEANKTIQGNAFVIDLFKPFLGSQICAGSELSPLPPTHPLSDLILPGATALFKYICIITVL